MKNFLRKFDTPQVGAGIGLLAAIITIICGLVVANNPEKTEDQIQQHLNPPAPSESPTPSHSSAPPKHETVHPVAPRPEPTPDETTVAPPPPPVSSPSPYKGSLVSLVEQLRTADEHNQGYVREEFGNRAPTAETRDQLILDEKRDDGTWLSLWDGREYNSPDGLDADHTVALAEAWGSGAWGWTEDKRIAYANDLKDPYVLNLITAALNRGPKSDNDPFDWVPSTNTCEYVKEWATVKLEWGLSADGEEKLALHNRAVDCDAQD